jgi:alkylhydroperoxidase family enzyme
MTRVTLHTVDSAPSGARPALERLVESSPLPGGILNLWAAMAGAPVTLAAYAAIRDAISEHATLDPRTRTAVALTAGNALGGAYSQAVNTRLARRAGWTDEETVQIRAGAVPDERLATLLAVVREATGNMGHVDAATWSAATVAGWTDADLVEAFTFVALVMYVDCFIHYVDADVDVPTAPPVPRRPEEAA